MPLVSVCGIYNRLASIRKVALPQDPWKTQLTAGGWCSPRFYFHSWILVGSEVAQCYEIRAFVVKISLWSGTEAWRPYNRNNCGAVPWCGTEVSPDPCREGWVCWWVQLTPHGLKFTDPGLAAWLSALHLLLLQERQKKGDTVLGTAAQHLPKKCCRDSAALQTVRVWRGFSNHKELLGLWFSCSCCSCGFFAGSAFCRAEQQETSAEVLSAEVLHSCYGYFYKEWMKETAKCVFIQRRPLLEFPEIMDTILSSLLPLEKDE